MTNTDISKETGEFVEGDSNPPTGFRLSVFMILTPRLSFLVPAGRHSFSPSHTYIQVTVYTFAFHVDVAANIMLAMILRKRVTSQMENSRATKHLRKDPISLWWLGDYRLSVLLTIDWIYTLAKTAIALIWCAKLARRQLWQRLDGDTNSVSVDTDSGASRRGHKDMPPHTKFSAVDRKKHIFNIIINLRMGT